MDPSHKSVRETYLQEHPEYIPLYKPYIEPPEPNNHSDSINNSNNNSVFNSPEPKNNNSDNLINNSGALSPSKHALNSLDSRSSSDSPKKSPIKKLLSTYKDKLRKVKGADNKFKEPYQLTEVDRELEREEECDGAASPDLEEMVHVRSMSEGEPYRTKAAYVPDGSVPVVSQAETSASSSTASGVTIRHHKAIRRSSRYGSDNTCDTCSQPKPCECAPRRKSMPVGSMKRDTETSAPTGLTRGNANQGSFRGTRDSLRSERVSAPSKPPKPDGLTRSLSLSREAGVTNAPVTRDRLPSPEYMNIPEPIESPAEPEIVEEEDVSDSEREKILEQIFNAASVEDLTKPEDEYDENMPPLQRFQRSNTTVVRNRGNKHQTPATQSVASNDNASELTPFFRDHEVLAEYKLLCNNVSSGVYVIPSPHSLQVWNGVIFLKIGMFADGCFKFNLNIPDDFPYSRPSLQFITPVFHPQVNDNGELNLSKAFPTWTPRKDRVW